jgi:hypothetical protein
MSDVAQPANWYADPTGRHQHRYWNGTEWTDQVADSGVTATDPPLMPTAGPVLMPEPGAPPAAWKPTPAGPRPKAGRTFSWLAAVGGLVLAVGSFLNAFTLLGEDYSYISDGRDGQLTLPAGIAVVVLAILLAVGTLPRWGAFFVVAAGGIAALVGVADVVDVQDKVDQAGGLMSPGPAMWVCVAGGVMAVVFALLAYFKPEAPAEG